jgi:uncharacterized protein (UPF0332 family)
MAQQPPSNGSPDPDDFFDPGAIEDYRHKSREFLARSQAFLTEGDLHQASEKGWGAAAWMAKAVATAQGWEYRKHSQFSVVMDNARRLTGNDRLRGLRSIANELHGNYYVRDFLLREETIELDLNSMAELLDILEPLTEPAR